MSGPNPSRTPDVSNLSSREYTVALAIPSRFESSWIPMRGDSDSAAMSLPSSSSMLVRSGIGVTIDLDSLHHITSGSAQLDPRLFHEFRERFGISLVNVYGSSEGAMLIACEQDIPDELLASNTLFRDIIDA